MTKLLPTKRPMTKAELVGEFEKLSHMSAFLLCAAGEVMRSDSLPNESVRCGFDELSSLVSKRMEAAVEALTDMPEKEKSVLELCAERNSIRAAGEANHE